MSKSKKTIHPPDKDQPLSIILKKLHKKVKSGVESKQTGREGKGGSSDKGGKSGGKGGKAGGRDSGTKAHPKGIYRIPTFMSGSLETPVPGLHPNHPKKHLKTTALPQKSSLPQKERKTTEFPNRNPIVKKIRNSQTINVLPKKDFLIVSNPLTHADTTQLYLESLKKYHKIKTQKKPKNTTTDEVQELNFPYDLETDHRSHPSHKKDKESISNADLIGPPILEKEKNHQINNISIEGVMAPMPDFVLPITGSEKAPEIQVIDPINLGNTEKLPLDAHIVEIPLERVEQQMPVENVFFDNAPESIQPESEKTSLLPPLSNSVGSIFEKHITVINENPLLPHTVSHPHEKMRNSQTTSEPIIPMALPDAALKVFSPALNSKTKQNRNATRLTKMHLQTQKKSSKELDSPTPVTLLSTANFAQKPSIKQSSTFEIYQKLMSDIKILETEKNTLWHQLEALKKSNKPEDSKVRYTTNIQLRQMDIKISFLHKKATTLLPSQPKPPAKTKENIGSKPLLPSKTSKKKVVSNKEGNKRPPKDKYSK